MRALRFRLRPSVIASEPEERAPLPADARSLEIRARRLMENRSVGAYDSVFRGHGVEFSEVRAYQPGDPFQAIDWKVTARMGRPFVKRFVEERELSVLLALDVSASTGFGTRRRAKRDLGREVAAVLGLAASRNNDRVGLLLFSDRVERFIPPRRGRGRLRQLLHVMVTHRPRGRGTEIRVALETASRLLKTRSLLFVLSDFQAPPFGRALAAAARRHDLVGIHLLDPAEEELPAAGLVAVRDPETGRSGVLDLHRAEVRGALREGAAERERHLSRLFAERDADRIVLRTDRPYGADLAAFFASRARARLR